MQQSGPRLGQLRLRLPHGPLSQCTLPRSLRIRQIQRASSTALPATRPCAQASSANPGPPARSPTGPSVAGGACHTPHTSAACPTGGVQSCRRTQRRSCTSRARAPDRELWPAGPHSHRLRACRRQKALHGRARAASMPRGRWTPPQSPAPGASATSPTARTLLLRCPAHHHHCSHSPSAQQLPSWREIPLRLSQAMPRDKCQVRGTARPVLL
mmetsp:Transcript_63241/g.184800  ORF Transcript_63241/g.184800 Transcript_63241/m.184800 type:complete len:213 (+) Transcript_63241:409-1047(+)